MIKNNKILVNSYDESLYNAYKEHTEPGLIVLFKNSLEEKLTEDEFSKLLYRD